MVSGCCPIMDEPMRTDIAMVKKHEQNFATKMKTERGWYLNCTGGAMFNDIEKIAIGFEISEKVTLEKARALMVETALAYLNEINSDDKLRPYLHEVPFKPKNLDISLVFQFDPQDETSIKHVSLMFNEITYYKEKQFFEETFEEAQQKLKGE